MPVSRHVRLTSGRTFEVQVSVHRYLKGRKAKNRHGLLLEAREGGVPGRAPLELLIDLSYLFTEAQAAGLLKLSSERARDRALEELLGEDTDRGVTVSAPGLSPTGELLLAHDALEAEHTLMSHRGPCRVCCVPGQNTVKLRVLDADSKELMVCSLPPGMLRLPDRQQEPMWWGEVTLNPFDISWERLEAPSVPDAIRAVLEALTCQESLKQRAESDSDWVTRCGDLVARGLGRLTWSEPAARVDALEHRVVRALAPAGDRYGLEIDRPTFVTYHLNLPGPGEEGVMDLDRVERRIRQAMADLAAGLFVRGGGRKPSGAGKHVRVHSTYFARHPSEMLHRILNLAYTRTSGFDVTPALAPREVEVSLYELKDYAMTVAAKLRLNWTDEVSRCAKDAILEAVSKYSGTWEAPRGRSGGVIAHIKATVKRRLKDLANPRVHRSLPGGAMAPVIATSLKLAGVPMDRAVPRDTEVPAEELWQRLERNMEEEAVEKPRAPAPGKVRRVHLAAAAVAREISAEINAHQAEALELLEQDEPGEEDLDEWLDRRARAEVAVQALQVIYLSGPDAGLDEEAWQRRCLWRWYLELDPRRRDEARDNLRRGYLSLVFMNELQRAFKQAARGGTLTPMDTARLRREPHRFPEWFAGWLVEGQRRIGERLPSAEKIDKKLLPEELFLQEPSGDIQLERFLVRAVERMAFSANVFLTPMARGEPYPAAAAACGGMDVQRLICAANSNRLETDGHWHDVLVQYIHNDPNLYCRTVPVLYDDQRTVEALCELLCRNSLRMGCLRRGHPYEVQYQAPHSPELIGRLVELASETDGTPRHQHFWRFKDLDMQSEQQVAEAVEAVPWSELRALLGPEVCRIMDAPLPDGSTRTFRDLKATEIFIIAHKLGRKNSWFEEG